MPPQDAPAKDASHDTAPARRSRWYNRATAVGGGLAVTLATPPFDQPAGVFVGLVAVAWLIQRAQRGREAFFLGWLFGASALIVGMRFVPSVIQRFTSLPTSVSYLALALLALAQGLTWAISIWTGHSLLRRGKVPLEIATGSAMFVRLSLPGIFTWSPAALLAPWPWLTQGADILGELGLSVAIAMSMASVSRSLQAIGKGQTRRWQSWTPAATAALLWLIHIGYGKAQLDRWSTPTNDRVDIGLVHAAVDPKERWQPRRWKSILKRLRLQTRRAEQRGAELSIWPEGAYPYPMQHSRRRMPRNKRSILGAGVRGPVLFGYMASEKAEQQADGSWRRNKYNSATIVMPGGKLTQRHDKMELLAFGEAVPLSSTFPSLRRIFQPSGSVLPGTELRRLDLVRSPTAVRALVLNCYEDTLAGYTRDAVHSTNPNLLVNITNDAWFIDSHAPELHWRLSILRSIETRLDLVRAVNQGPSGWIDAAGTVRAKSARSVPFALNVRPSLRQHAGTIYTRYGSFPTTILLALAVISALVRSRSTPGAKKRPHPEGEPKN